MDPDNPPPNHLSHSWDVLLCELNIRLEACHFPFLHQTQHDNVSTAHRSSQQLLSTLREPMLQPVMPGHRRQDESTRLIFCLFPFVLHRRAWRSPASVSIHHFTSSLIVLYSCFGLLSPTEVSHWSLTLFCSLLSPCSLKLLSSRLKVE